MVARFREELAAGRSVIVDGRATIAMETYVRLMVLKRRYRWLPSASTFPDLDGRH